MAHQETIISIKGNVLLKVSSGPVSVTGNVLTQHDLLTTVACCRQKAQSLAAALEQQFGQVHIPGERETEMNIKFLDPSRQPNL